MSTSAFQPWSSIITKIKDDDRFTLVQILEADQIDLVSGRLPIGLFPSGDKYLLRSPSLLYLACFYGSTDIYHWLVEHVPGDTSIDERFPPAPNGPTLLQYALRRSRPVNLEIITDLLRNGANLRNAVESAISTGDVNAFNVIFEAVCKALKIEDPCDALFQSIEGSPLRAAIKSESLEMVLRINGIEPHELKYLRPRAGVPPRSPLFVALKHQQFEIMCFLLENSETITEVDKATGQTPLVTYIKYARQDFPDFEDLMFARDWSAVVNIPDNSGATALHYAIRRSLVRIAARLLEIDGIDVGRRDARKRSPFHTAVVNCNPPLMEALLERDYDLANDKDDLGRNPLHTAVRQKWRDGVTFLLEVCPSLASATDDSGLTPILYTGIYESVECFRAFSTSCHQGVLETVTRQCQYKGWTLLHYCAHEGNYVLLKAALEATRPGDGQRFFPDVNIRAEDQASVTPLFLSTSKLFVKCTLLLMLYGGTRLSQYDFKCRSLQDRPKATEIRAILNMSPSELQDQWDEMASYSTAR
jgi:ankyrin repeat protein